MSRTAMLLGTAALLVAFVVFDTVAATDGHPGNTLSEIVMPWAMYHPLAATCVGILLGGVLGHLLWPQTFYRDAHLAQVTSEDATCTRTCPRHCPPT